MNAIEIINVVFNGLICLTAILALIFGFFYFNKRLKIYCFEENQIIKIIAFDKGNGACFISKCFYYKNKNRKNKTSIPYVKNNEIEINKNLLGSFSSVCIVIIDNFGRKYLKKYVNFNKEH